MIGYLRGISRGGGIVDVSGVGYLVRTPHDLPTGDEVELFVHTQVREDSLTLFGFSHEQDRALFEALLKVAGVGAGTALALLRHLGAVGVADAVRRRDAKVLGAVKGVGPKLAEKIVMFAKLPDLPETDSRTADIASALTGLGWDRQTAAEAAEVAVSRCGEDADEGTLVAAAIAHAGSVRL